MQTKKILLATAVQNYKSTRGMNYEQLAKHWSVCKTTLYRAATGNWRKPTLKLAKIAEKAGVELIVKKEPQTCDPLLSAVNDIWDGTTEHAIALARLMRDIHAISERHALRQQNEQ